MSNKKNVRALHFTLKQQAARLLGLSLYFVFFTTVHAATPNLPPNLKSPLGINTNEAVAINAALPFVDLFRYAMPFEEARPWYTKGNIQYNKQGWPIRLNRGKVGTRFLHQIPPKALPAGHYTVLYEGKGKLRYGASAQQVKSGDGKDLIRFKPMENGKITATLSIKSMDERNPVRNIRILMPGGICADNPFRRVSHEKQCAKSVFLPFETHHEKIVFNPDYLNFMKDFKVIRFMNMSGVTRNPISSWNARPTLDKATWGGKEGVRGVPAEIMIDLANRLNSHPWFNVPHNADYHFIANFAKLVKSRLKPHLKVYLEYSNETWNNIFVPQAEHMKQTGYKMKLDKDRNVAGSKYYAMQSVRIFKIWEKEFGGTDRLVRILGGMTTSTHLTHTLLGYQNSYKHVDAIAVAPYFHMSQEDLKGIRSVNDVFTKLDAKDNRYSLKNVLEFVKRQSDIARAYGVELIAYEGGQHLVDHKTHSMQDGATPHLYQANRDPRMAQAYYRLLKGWRESGGTLFVAFSAPRPATWHGSWGVKEYITQNPAKTPKYRALLAFKRGEPCWWRGCEAGLIPRQEKPRVIPTSLVAGTSAAGKFRTESVNVYRQNQPRYTLHSAKAQNITRLINGTISNHTDLSGRWRTAWDDKHLKLWVNVIDEKAFQDSGKIWADDSIELYLDTDNSKKASYDGVNDFTISFRANNKHRPVIGKINSKVDISGVQYKFNPHDKGYVFTAELPWKTLGIKPRDGARIGFDIQINDDDTGGERDAKIAWNAAADQAWKDPRLFGELVLVDPQARKQAEISKMIQPRDLPRQKLTRSDSPE